MFAVKRPNCPLCKEPSNGRHCIRNIACIWFTCNRCTLPKGSLVTFDDKGRFFFPGKVK